MTYELQKLNQALNQVLETPPVQVYSSSASEGGEVHKVRFPNGYGASVIRTKGSYGGKGGLWELGIIIFKTKSIHSEEFTRETSINRDWPDDVRGWLTDEEVVTLLTQISQLAPH